MLTNKITLEPKELLLMILTGIMAVEIDKTIELLRNIDLRYRSGKMSKHCMSLPVWSAYVLYGRYMHIVDVEWLNFIEND